MGLSIIVPIKQVPDIERVRFDIEKGRIDRSSAPGETNPFDLNALEAAVRIKEQLGGMITAISMGPPQAISTLRDAIARGADEAILLTDIKFAGADTLATSYTLASAIRKIGKFDLIICGEKTVDGDTGQVGPEIAAFLNIPHVAYVCEIRKISCEGMVVVSDMGDAYYLVEISFPVLITVTKDINTPRLPTLKDKIKARKKQVTIWTARDLEDIADPRKFGYAGSPTQVYKITFPSVKNRKGMLFEGEEGIPKIVSILEREGII